MSHNYFWYEDQFFLQLTCVAMLTKFAPSVANLLMAHWEESVIFAPPWHELIFWRCYVDDVLFIWKGSVDMLT